MPRPSRKELIVLAKEDPGAIADRFLAQWERVEHLEKRIPELERNSRTSSKPPSSDKGNFSKPRKTKSTRKRAERNQADKRAIAGLLWTAWQIPITSNITTFHPEPPAAAAALP